MKRRILLVDDDLAILLTLKAVLEISGFEVETAASAREAKQRLKSNEYHMVITDLRMESETAGEEVAAAAKKAANRPAVAMLTAYPPKDADWANDLGHGQGSGEADEHAGSAAADRGDAGGARGQEAERERS